MIILLNCLRKQVPDQYLFDTGNAFTSATEDAIGWRFS